MEPLGGVNDPLIILKLYKGEAIVVYYVRHSSGVYCLNALQPIGAGCCCGNLFLEVVGCHDIFFVY